MKRRSTLIVWIFLMATGCLLVGCRKEKEKILGGIFAELVALKADFPELAALSADHVTMDNYHFLISYREKKGDGLWLRIELFDDDQGGWKSIRHSDHERGGVLTRKSGLRIFYQFDSRNRKLLATLVDRLQHAAR